MNENVIGIWDRDSSASMKHLVATLGAMKKDTKDIRRIRDRDAGQYLAAIVLRPDSTKWLNAPDVTALGMLIYQALTDCDERGLRGPRFDPHSVSIECQALLDGIYQEQLRRTTQPQLATSRH